MEAMISMLPGFRRSAALDTPGILFQLTYWNGPILITANNLKLGAALPEGYSAYAVS